jgi:predicted GNAT family acetyltransferase
MKQDQQALANARVARDEPNSRYTMVLGDQLAGFAEYREQGGQIHFTHTVVQEEFEGQGVGSRLAAFALDDARSRGLKVVPQCSFIAAYVKRHEKDYGDLVAGAT